MIANGIRRIVAATDLSERGQRAIDRAFVLARIHGAAVTVAHAVDDELPESIARAIRLEAEAAAERQTQDAGRATVRILRGRTSDALAQLCEAERADILVAGPHRIDALWSVLRGATTQRLVALVPVPVYVARRAGGKPVNTILAAVDFSVAAATALRTAAILYPDAVISTVHVYDLVKAAFVHGEPLLRYEHEIRMKAEAELKAFEARVGLTRIGKRLVLRGHPVETILTEAGRIGADLIVMGTQGQTGLGAFLLGSVASAVLGRSDVDILVAKAW